MDPLNELFFMHQTWSTLFSTANKLQITGDKYLKKLTIRQIMVLIAIIHLPENETTLNNIAKMLGTSKQNVKQIVSSLEKKDYLKTFICPKDHRALNIHITKIGKTTLLDCSEPSLKYFADIFHEFSTEEMETLWNLLKKLFRFDGREQVGFEESPSYGAENGFSKSQLQAIHNFKDQRAQDINNQTKQKGINNNEK